MKTATSLVCVLLLTSCSDPGADRSSGTGGNGTGTTTGFGEESAASTGAAACVTVSQVAENVQPSDIVIVVNESPGVQDEVAQVLQPHLNDLSNRLAASGVDAHIVLIADGVCVPAPLGSGTCDAAPSDVGIDSKLPNYLHVREPVGTNTLEAILETYPRWSSMSRPGASKVFFVVSDVDATMSATDFTSQMIAADPNFGTFWFGGMFPPHTDQMGCESQTFEPTAYQQLIAQTTGFFCNIACPEFADYDTMFTRFGDMIVGRSAIACNFPIPDPPPGETLDFAKVNVEHTPFGGSPSQIFNVPAGASACGANGGWYYDDPSSPTEILLCPTTCDAIQGDAGGKVDVLFGCDTVVVPA